MRDVVRKWETSQESQAVFARRHGVSVSKLAYWTRRFRREESTTLAPLHVVGTLEPAAAGAIEVTLATGERLTIREGTSAELVRTVVSTLRPSC